MLVETKLNGAVGDYLQQLWGNRWVEGVWLESIGSKGGIIVLGNKTMEKGSNGE